MTSSSDYAYLIVCTRQGQEYRMPGCEEATLRHLVDAYLHRGPSCDSLQVTNSSGAFLSIPLRICRALYVQRPNEEAELLLELVP